MVQFKEHYLLDLFEKQSAFGFTVYAFELGVQFTQLIQLKSEHIHVVNNGPLESICLDHILEPGINHTITFFLPKLCYIIALVTYPLMVK